MICSIAELGKDNLDETVALPLALAVILINQSKWQGLIPLSDFKNSEKQEVKFNKAFYFDRITFFIRSGLRTTWPHTWTEKPIEKPLSIGRAHRRRAKPRRIWKHFLALDRGKQIK